MNRLSIKANWSIMMVGIAIFLSMTCWAGDRGQGGAPANRLTPREGRGPGLDTVQVTIEKKSLGMVTTNIGDKFTLSDNTIIVHTDGQQVSIREMLVPCEAQIGYRTEKGVRLAERIDIQQVGANATSQWSSERPE